MKMSNYQKNTQFFNDEKEKEFMEVNQKLLTGKYWNRILDSVCIPS